MYKVLAGNLTSRGMFDVLISADALADTIDQPGWRIIDCRFDLADPAAGRRMYEAAHIAGAVFADLDKDLAAQPGPLDGRHPLPDVDAFERTLGQLGVTNSTNVVVYDAGTGALASRAWWMLRWVGHAAVYLLDGGLAQWLRKDCPVRDGVEHPEPVTYVAAARPEIVIETAELAADPGNIGALRLVDARDAERFRGENEPIDPVAGHIPGAINVPLARSLNDDGTWKTTGELRELWQGVLGPEMDKPWAVMCGSGVTACHLAISGMLAGYREPRLYAGSWSEWIRDPARPVGLGGD